ncbi:hypothetical protein ATY41_06895 [Leifsonia xyli subsp. xyli]|uniref:Uncharacterized protein n=2 Tax=Leifsonia xyli TaxID=1575 RepID=A0A1E2SMY3_LEIXY|nr:hypothetical protein ATY41_06895 [Leifsonia xyli subsp. xyli]
MNPSSLAAIVVLLDSLKMTKKASRSAWTLWQHWNDVSPYAGPGDLMPGDQDFFRGTRLALKRFSNNVHW